ncbi:MAG: hypothetical protein PVF43_13610 [Candidatus Eiseniibacteriota bacterium]
MSETPPDSRPPGRGPTPQQISAWIQLILSAALFVALLLALWWFFRAADRLGGAGRFYYVPLGMVGFLAFAGFRCVQAYRQLRRAGRRPPPR